MAAGSSHRFAFSGDNQWNGSGEFPQGLRQLSPLQKWIKNFAQEFSRIEEIYRKYIGNDGKLVGQEKGSLLRELNRILGGLILFRRYVSVGQPSGFTSRHTRRDYHFSITFTGGSWHGEGTLGRADSYDISTFAAWYKDMAGGIRELFQLYGQCLEDRILENRERQDLQEKTEYLIYQVLAIQRELHQGSLIR